MAHLSGKAKRIDAPPTHLPKVLPKRLPKRAGSARVDPLDKVTRARFESELETALKRKPTPQAEIKLAGALRALAKLSPSLRSAMADATKVMVRRGSYGRELYAACVRALAEAEDPNLPPLLKTALAADDMGGSATLSAASLCKDPSLAASLAKLAASPRAHVAFSAEIARVRRLESTGAYLASLAPMIKESHRIALCVEYFVPLVRSAPLPIHVAPGLDVLRRAERHLGRWLVLAEITTKAGDPAPLREALANTQTGPASARAAWSFVAWALAQAQMQGPALGSTRDVPPPKGRPTVELVARLSDRPSANRDTTFLFRLADAGVAGVRPMLEALVKGPVLEGDVAIRAASYLVRDRDSLARGYQDRDDRQHALLEALIAAAKNTKREELRGLAVAALWDAADAGDTGMTEARSIALDLASELVTTRCLTSAAWGALVRAAGSMSDASPEVREPSIGHASSSPIDAPTSGVAPTSASSTTASTRLLQEATFRWTQWGWLE